jgi:HUS1 checkpoint protein
VQVSILLPSLATMRTVVERLKTVSNKIHVLANYAGEFRYVPFAQPFQSEPPWLILLLTLRLKAISDDAKVQTEWRGLKHPEAAPGEDTPQPSNPNVLSSVCVEAKSLLKALSCHAIGTVAIGCVCAKHCLILYVYLGDARSEGENGVLTYFLPAVSGDDED